MNPSDVHCGFCPKCLGICSKRAELSFFLLVVLKAKRVRGTKESFVLMAQLGTVSISIIVFPF